MDHWAWFTSRLTFWFISSWASKVGGNRRGSLPSNLINYSDQKDFGAGWEIGE